MLQVTFYLWEIILILLFQTLYLVFLLVIVMSLLSVIDSIQMS